MDSLCADLADLLLFHGLRPAQWRVILEKDVRWRRGEEGDGDGVGGTRTAATQALHTHYYIFTISLTHTQNDDTCW